MEQAIILIYSAVEQAGGATGLIQYILVGLITLALGALAGVYSTNKRTQIDASKITQDAIEASRKSSLETLELALKTQTQQTEYFKSLWEKAEKELEEMRGRIDMLEAQLANVERRRAPSPPKRGGRRSNDPTTPPGSRAVETDS